MVAQPVPAGAFGQATAGAGPGPVAVVGPAAPSETLGMVAGSAASPTIGVPLSLLLVFDLLGVFFFAVSGCLLALTKKFDVLGSILLGGLAGLGGGVMRDVIMDKGVPTAIDEPIYLLPPVLAALLVWLGVLHPGRLRRTIMLADAAGLALFCVTGALVALGAGINAVGGLLLGVITAVGGGLLRDVVANEVPQVIDPVTGLYAVPAILGSTLVAGMWHIGWNHSTRLGPLEILVVALVFAFRVAAVKGRWRPPLAGPPERV